MSDDPVFLCSLRLCESSFSQMFIAYCVVYFSPSRKGRKDYIPLRESFLADVYCVIYFSPSRKGRKDYILLRESFLADVYGVVYFSPSRKGRKYHLQYQIIRVSSLLYPKWTPYYIVHSKN